MGFVVKYGKNHSAAKFLWQNRLTNMQDAPIIAVMNSKGAAV
jgi:hypothetical protein